MTTDGILLGEFDVHVKGPQLDRTVPARFFLDYQREPCVWAKIFSNRSIPFLAEVEVTAPGILEPFPAVLGGMAFKQEGASLSFSAELSTLRTPIESVKAKGLSAVTFALLDSPIIGDLLPEQPATEVNLRFGQFEAKITRPVEAHMALTEVLGTFPHRLTNSGSMTQMSGQPFNSSHARATLDTLHDALSFAAGRWIGITLVQNHSAEAEAKPKWFRWGTTRMSGTSNQPGWYDPQHPEWLLPLCDAFFKRKSDEETWEPIRTSLYWYVRSNTRDAGIDSSLILSQCALELLSWFVIVKETGALSEEGYGQLSSASEKLRLTLSLLGIPRQIPTGLESLASARNEWKDLADCLVQARNYLVHPTRSRSGKRRAQREYPWYELWLASQWLLELVMLRLLGYSGSYRNRTRWKEFNPVELVPWSQQS